MNAVSADVTQERGQAREQIPFFGAAHENGIEIIGHAAPGAALIT